MSSVHTRSWLDDTQSGFRAYDHRAIDSLQTDDSIADGMGASIDILYHASQHDYDIAEVSSTISYDVEEASTSNPLVHGLILIKNILQTAIRQ